MLIFLDKSVILLDAQLHHIMPKEVESGTMGLHTPHKIFENENLKNADLFLACLFL